MIDAAVANEAREQLFPLSKCTMISTITNQ